MKFTIIGHACLMVEASAKRLVIDPWLLGPVFWGSWWHWPEPVYDKNIFSADYIYITHWHFDHFNERTLSLFDKDCHILVPKFPVSTMVEQLCDIGFKNITELDQGAVFRMATSFELSSYQVQYQDDSVVVISADGSIIVDLNDAKPLPSTWRVLRKKFPNVDFLLRSHSPAWSYPSCYSFDDAADAIPVDKGSYQEAFLNAVRMLRPKYSIPFASGVCHLHRDGISENEFLVSAKELRDYMEAHDDDDSGSTTIVMPPGSSWTKARGFEIAEAGKCDDVHKYAKDMVKHNQNDLEKIYESESCAGISFEAFKAYFEGLLRSLVIVRPFLRIRWLFVVSSSAPEYWLVDVKRGQIEKMDQEPSAYTSKIEVPPSVLADALSTSVFTNIDIAKRWRVHIKKGKLTEHFLMMALVAVYEAGYFRIRNVLCLRFLTCTTKRWPEIIDYIVMLLRIITKGNRAAIDTVTRPMLKRGWWMQMRGRKSLAK